MILRDELLVTSMFFLKLSVLCSCLSREALGANVPRRSADICLSGRVSAQLTASMFAQAKLCKFDPNLALFNLLSKPRSLPLALQRWHLQWRPQQEPRREPQLVLESIMVAQLWSRPWLPPLRMILQDLQRLHRLGRRGTSCRTPRLLRRAGPPSRRSPASRRKDLAPRRMEEPVAAAALLTGRRTWHSRPRRMAA